GKLATGQRILITGASGAVGSMAVQLAKNKAAHVIGIGSGRNEEFVRKLGAAEFIDYKRTKFEDTVSGVDVVFDTVGGDTQERAFQTLKRGCSDCRKPHARARGLVDAMLTLSTSEMAALCRQCSHMHLGTNSLPRHFYRS